MTKGGEREFIKTEEEEEKEE
jgi:hypothetical protein